MPALTDEVAERREGGTAMLEHLPYTLTPALGARARIGLVVLSSDLSIEQEFRELLDPPGVAYWVARIPNDSDVSPETLAAMGPRLTETVALLPEGDVLQVVAYGCTSASMVLGPETVARAIHAARPGVKATNPTEAAFAAFKALGARRIAVLTPYSRAVNAIVLDHLRAGGLEAPVFGSFNEPHDPRVAEIDADSLRAAVRRLLDAAARAGEAVDAVFISCTALRAADAIAEIEAETGLPSTSSNHALAWRCLRLAGVEDARPERGRLFAL